MARYRRDLEIRSPHVRELRDVGTVGTVGSLRLRVDGTKVDAYVPIASSYRVRPGSSVRSQRRHRIAAPRAHHGEPRERQLDAQSTRASS